MVDVDEVPTVEPQTFHGGFDDFYRQELDSVVGLAYVLSGSSSGAEDLAQEGFLAAYRHWDRIGSFDDPGAWVRRVVANRAVSAFRRRRAELRTLMALSRPTYQVTELPSESAVVWEEVRLLPKRQAQVIALRYLDRRTISQVAQILECSENTVKTHLSRAKRTLATRLGKEFMT